MSRTTRNLESSLDLSLATYLAILGSLTAALWFILRYLLTSTDSEDPSSDGGAAVARPASKAPPPYFGAMDDEGTSTPCEERRSSFDDLYDGKICAICFENPKNCFFTPCGHCMSCFLCAEKLIKETRTCPVCRRLIHKARKMPYLGNV